MKLQQLNERENEVLRFIGSRLVRVMANQAVSRANGETTAAQMNENAALMTVATRAARQLIRLKKQHGDSTGLLTGESKAAFACIEMVNDGHLALGFITENQTVS